MSAAAPRHPVAGAATAAAARLTSAAADAKYRTPAFIDNMLKTGGYRIFVMLTHGEIVPNSGGPGFIVPPNTYVIQTGAGSTFSCVTSTDFDRIYLPRFVGKEINKTFRRFLGMEGSSFNTTLSPFLFNTPGEEALEKYIYLGNEDLRRTDSLWGVFYLDTVRQSLFNDPTLTSYVHSATERSSNDFYKQSDFITHINTVYPPSDSAINILMFVNCVVAPKDRGLKAKDYSRAMNIAGRMTHHGAPKDAAKVASAARKAAAALTDVTAHSIGAGPYGPAVGIAYGAAAAGAAAAPTGTSKFNAATGARFHPKGAAVPSGTRAPANTSRTEFGSPLPGHIFGKNFRDWRLTEIEDAVLAAHGMAPAAGAAAAKPSMGVGPPGAKPSGLSIGVGPTGAKPPTGAKSGKSGKKPRAGGRRTRKYRK
jgi:hypothetical protein